MSVYVCSICGYVYDESLGCPEKGIPAGTKWEDLPESFTCPVCGASKAAFEERGGEVKKEEVKKAGKKETGSEDDPLVLSALFLNLAKGAEKEARMEESGLFNELGEYYAKKAIQSEEDFSYVVNMLNKNVKEELPEAKEAAKSLKDRGALRALTWAEKVSTILKGIVSSFQQKGKDILAGKNIYVCEICGFIFIGEQKPEICPICKVPSLKIHQVTLGGLK